MESSGGGAELLGVMPCGRRSKAGATEPHAWPRKQSVAPREGWDEGGAGDKAQS